MPKNTSAKRQSKADFVRVQPPETPAKDVVAKAKEAKVSLTEDYVYKIRTLDRRTKTKGKGKGKRTSAKKATSTTPAASTPAVKKTRGRAPGKKNHVLALVADHPSWTADQIAKAVGCSVNYVYALWKKPKGAAARSASSTTSSTASSTGSASAARAPMSNGGLPKSGAVVDFYRALKRVGLDQAKELIANLEAFQKA